jgi:hypothetical protein
VIGTAATSPIEPTRVATISFATISKFATSVTPRTAASPPDSGPVSSRT